ncbi:CID domain-containing protein [Entamoeba marina]
MEQDTSSYDNKLMKILRNISEGPEVVGCFPLENIIELSHKNPSCVQTLLLRLSQFIDESPPMYLLSSLYIIDALIRYCSDEIAFRIEEKFAKQLGDIVKKICMAHPPIYRERTYQLFDHWYHHRTFDDKILHECFNILVNPDSVLTEDYVKIKTNVILLTQLPSDWNEYRIKEFANEVTPVLRVSMKPERHFAFIATPTRGDAEKLKSVLVQRVNETRTHAAPKVVWGTEYWMKTFKFEDEEGICTIAKDKIPSNIRVNVDGSYVAEKNKRKR